MDAHTLHTTHRLISLLVLCALVGGSACGSAPPTLHEWGPLPPEPDYPLDPETRRAPGRGKPACPVVQLVRYEGDVVPYHRPLRVNPFFRERLQQFEMVVAAAAIEIYGRPPEAIRHFGAYNCRRIRGKPKLSEHAFGNALDVKGFDFGPAPDGKGPVPQAFRVVLEDHWSASGSPGRHHAAFLHLLAEMLAARPDIFRGMLGPSASGHKDHFHFDVGPYRYIEI